MNIFGLRGLITEIDADLRPADNEDRAQRVEEEKQKQLKAQKEGRNEWTDSLSSDSESIVRATNNFLHRSNANSYSTGESRPR